MRKAVATNYTNSRRWRLPYLLLFAGTVLTISGVEAALLQVKYDYFTGGFLAVNVVRTGLQAAGFFCSSIVLDSFLVLAVWTLLIPLLSRMPFTKLKAFIVAGLLTPVIPFAADYLNYELHAYFKDMLDIPLIWELSDKNPKEIIAQWGIQLLIAGVAVVFGIAMLIGAARIAHRVALRAQNGRWSLMLPRFRTAAIAAAASLIAGIVILVGVTAAASPVAFGLNKKPSGIVVRSIVQFVTDFDRDGYGLLSQPAENAYFNGSIHPYAVDIPGNGIDENGVGGDHPKDFQPETEDPDKAGPWARKPDVLLILLESYRADLLGKSVNGREITPFLNRLAREGAAAAHAYSHCGYTVPSRAQMFGGRITPYPGQTTLIDDFQEQGYYAAHFSGQDDSFGNSGPLLGYDRADIFYDARADKDKRYSAFSTPASLAVPWKLVNRRVFEFLERFDAGRPLFLYVNFHDTHFPYHHRELDNLLGIDPLPRSRIRPGMHERIWETYANSAANVDLAIGRLVQVWQDRLRGRPKMVIVTSDHAESLFEHGFLGHGYAVDAEQTRVPFIVWGDAGTWYEPLGLADVRRQLLANLRAEAAPARMVPDPSRVVMQYIGPLATPRMLAWRTLDGVTIYDFWGDRTIVRRNVGEESKRGLDPGLVERIWEWEAMLREPGQRNGAKFHAPS